MKFLALFFIGFSLQIAAAEVATFSDEKSSKQLSLILTDSALLQELENQLIANSCKPRIQQLSPQDVKQAIFPVVCRALVTKFLLNSGYKALDRWTFTK